MTNETLQVTCMRGEQRKLYTYTSVNVGLIDWYYSQNAGRSTVVNCMVKLKKQGQVFLLTHKGYRSCGGPFINSCGCIYIWRRARHAYARGIQREIRYYIHGKLRFRREKVSVGETMHKITSCMGFWLSEYPCFNNKQTPYLLKHAYSLRLGASGIVDTSLIYIYLFIYFGNN